MSGWRPGFFSTVNKIPYTLMTHAKPNILVPSMYDMYRQHRSNPGENDDWIQKNTQSEQKFWKKSLLRLLLLANTFYGCLFKTSNQIENGTIDFLFKMHLVWSLGVPKNQKCLEKVTQFSENFVFFRHFMFLCFWAIFGQN